MADFSRTSFDKPSSSHTDHEQPVSMSPRHIPSPSPENGGAALGNGPRPGTSSGIVAGIGAGVGETSPVAAFDAGKSDMSQRVEDVLGSDVRFRTMTLHITVMSLTAIDGYNYFTKPLEAKHCLGKGDSRM